MHPDSDRYDLPTMQRWTVSAMGDANMRCLQKGDILQLERKGYFRVDVPLLKPSASIILFAIS